MQAGVYTIGFLPLHPLPDLLYTRAQVKSRQITIMPVWRARRFDLLITDSLRNSPEYFRTVGECRNFLHRHIRIVIFMFGCRRAFCIIPDPLAEPSLPPPPFDPFANSNGRRARTACDVKDERKRDRLGSREWPLSLSASLCKLCNYGMPENAPFVRFERAAHRRGERKRKLRRIGPVIFTPTILIVIPRVFIPHLGVLLSRWLVRTRKRLGLAKSSSRRWCSPR